jgi:hypothetical protein
MEISKCIIVWMNFFWQILKYSQLSIIRANGGDGSHG